jgi:methylmalonyl-CoA/ethylmalonyl-CoA epimerase
MNDIQARLIECFEAVFPGLSREDIMCASPSTIAEWDSLSVATLMAVIEEEIGILVPVEQFTIDEASQMSVFERLHEFLSTAPKEGAP